MKKALRIFGIVALLALVVLQFIRPEKNESGYDSIVFFEKDTKPTQKVAAILKEHCYDCHSNQTRYPWYAEVAPISFWLADHIEHGTKHFNASAWESYSVKKKDHKLEELIEMVEEGEMPLPSYTWTHGSLSEEDADLLIQWATVTRLQYKNDLKVSSK